MYINSLQNQYIKLAKSLQQKSGRQKSNSFLIEGEKILEEAFKNNISIDYIFTLDENSHHHYDLEPLLKKYHCKAQIFKVDESIMKKIVTTETLVSVAAIAKQFSKEEPEINNFVLYCEEIQDPGNLGSIIRSGFAAGVTSILLSPNCADIFNPKTIRSSKGTLFCGCIKQDLELNDLSKFKNSQILGSSSHTENSYKDLKKLITKPNVIVMAGNEANGLSKEALDACDTVVRIPMANDIESLNVTAATSILLFEIKDILDTKWK